MINFRYHVVSLTAVFLALVIGVVMGSTVVSKATVDGLRHNLNTVENRIRSTEADNSALHKQLSQYGKQNAELTDQMLTPLVKGTLTDVPVLLIASQGIDSQTLGQVRTTLLDAGARFDGTLLVDDRLALTGANTTKLAQLLDVDPSSDVMSVLVNRLAEVLGAAAAEQPLETTTTTTTRKPRTSTTASASSTTSPGSPTPSTVAPSSTSTTESTIPSASGVTQPELITELRQAGFLDFRPPDGGSSSDLILTTHKYDYVVVSGPTPDVPNEQFLYPLLQKMAATGPTTVVAASAATGNQADANRTAFVGPIRKDPTMSGRISTVDDLERFSGLAALAFSLRDLPKRHGDYGFGAGADSLFPNPSQ